MEKRGRVLDASEAQRILETTSTHKTLISWFDPFWSQMIDAIEKKKSTTILGGQNFEVRQSANQKEYIFKAVGDFVPMIRVSLNRLITYASVKDAVTTN